jgi:ribosomal protein S18 acetylase RimI-like enzyme
MAVLDDAPKVIVEGTAADHQALVTTLALAFQDDPAVSWIFPDAAQRRRRLQKMFDIILPGDLLAGIALRSPGDEVATLWRAPGKAHSSNLEMLRLAFPLIWTFGTAIGRALAIADAIEAHHPKGFDYWYLHYAAVRPQWQGKGWGGTAIRAGLARAEADGKPAYLETATLSNVGLYQRLGFAVIDEWDVAKGGPHFWSMLKE